MPREAARQRRLCSCKAFTDLSSEQRPLRRHGLRIACGCVPRSSEQRPLRRHGLRIACGCVPRRERSLRRSSSPKKVTPRLCCSLVNALATRRLATNFFRYQAVGCCAFPPVGGKRLQTPFGRSTGKHDIIEKIHNKLFQPMQCPSVDGRFVIIVCIFSRSAQVHRPYDLNG